MHFLGQLHNNLITLTFSADTPSTPDASVQRTDGMAAVGSGSSNIMNPMTVNGVPSGPRIGNWPILELIDCGGNLTWHYRCENQLGTLEGMTNEEGIRVAEFDTSKYGEVYHKHILFDGRASRIDSASWEPLSQVTHILLVPGVFFPEEVLGAVLRATNSESAATAVVTGLDPNGAFIKFDDPKGAVADVINSDGQFVIWDNRQTAYTDYPTTGGTWTNVELTSDPQFGDLTILTSGGELFAEFMVGWQVQIDAAVPVYLDIVTTTGDGICVSGDVSALVTADETEFCIIHPVGVNPQNGATQTDPCQPESRYLWGGGYYLPPIVGFEMWHNADFGVFGAQTGNNKSGQHYMWNRRYDIDMGRWTTTDPASVFFDLLNYVLENPLSWTDPSGLGIVVRIATMGGSDPEKDDNVEIAAKAVAKNVSRSADDFFTILAARYIECIHNKVATRQSTDECCIERIEVYGHNGNDLGGGPSTVTVPVIGANGVPTGSHIRVAHNALSKAQIEFLQSIMCDDASVENYQCTGADVTWKDWADANRQMMELLLKKGGTYEGFSACTQYKWWKDENGEIKGKVWWGDPERPRSMGVWSKVKIKGGSTIEDVQEEYEEKLKEDMYDPNDPYGYRPKK